MKKPSPIHLGAQRVRAVRGPKDGRWYWRAQIYTAGEERTLWVGWYLPEEAAARAALELLHPKTPPRPQAPTVLDVLDWWLAQEQRKAQKAGTIKLKTAVCRRLVALAGDLLASQVTLPALEQMQAQALKLRAPATVQLDIRTLRQALAWAHTQGLTSAPPPAPRLVVRPARARPTPRREVVLDVVQALPDGWPRLLGRLLAATGARIGELANLQVRAWDGHLLHLDGKTGARAFPLHGSLAADLTRAQAGRQPSDPLVGVRPSTVRQAFPYRLTEACARAGAPRLTPHAFRRAAVRALLKAGVDVRTAADLMGHTPAVMLSRYAESDEEDRRAAALGAGLGDVPPARLALAQPARTAPPKGR